MKQTPIESIDASQNVSKVNNTNNLDVYLNNLTTSNVTNDSIKNFNSENGDIKFNHSKVVDLVSHSNDNKNNDKLNAFADVITTEAVNSQVVNFVNNEEHQIRKDKQGIVKKTKYQDFDASLVPDEGIFSSIMKVLGLNQCSATPPDLIGPIEIDTSPEYLENVESRLSPKIQAGGRYKPTQCRARDRVAIVIPYRDRKQHLPILLKNLHPFLMKQQIEYGIFIVEQSADGNFNRAKLFNIGFVEALKLYDWDCFIFHDVDLLPMDDRNLYSCPTQPRHMSVAVDTFGYK